LTGATGLLGRNLLFEIVKQNLSRLNRLEILVLGRSSKSDGALRERVRGILASDEFDSLRLSADARELLLSRVIKCVDMDFSSGDLRIAPAARKTLEASPIDWFFHSAGLTDLRHNRSAEDALERINVEGTRLLLCLASQLQIGEFCYVGTAYACGNATGMIAPDYTDPSRGFRNPYERSKLAAEVLVREFARKTGTRCRYFRPSTICGRLIEEPLGAISKFEMFYSWTAFFVRMMRKSAPHSRKLNMRLCYTRGRGLNIVPVDYVAKVMYLVCDQRDPSTNYHLVNEMDMLHEVYTSQMLEAIGVTGVTSVEQVPGEKNALEELYYRSVGAVFTPYVTSAPMTFDTTNLQPLLKSSGFKCPQMNQKALGSLMVYAIEREFGLNCRHAERASSSVMPVEMPL